MTTLAASDFGSSLGDFFVQLLSALKPLFTVTAPVPVIVIIFLALLAAWAVKS